MKNYTFDQEIDSKGLERICEIINDAEKESDDIRLIFTTKGGSVSDALMMAHLLNKCTVDVEINIIWQCDSAGIDFILALDEEVTTFVHPLAHGMLHMVDRDTSWKDTTFRKTSTDAILIDQISKINERFNTLFLPHLTEDQKKIYLEGGDIRLLSDDLSTFLRNVRETLKKEPFLLSL